jgi:hypothetical protein
VTQLARGGKFVSVDEVAADDQVPEPADKLCVYRNAGISVYLDRGVF